MRRILGVVICVALALGTAACGSGGDDGKAAEALSKSLQKNDGAGDLQLSAKEADCVAEKMVDKVGTEDLQKYGILTEDLETEDEVGDVTMSESDAEGAAESMTACVDAVDMVVKSLGDAAGKEAGECLRGELEESDVQDFFVALFRGDQEAATQKLMGPMMSCADAGQSGEQ